MDEEVKSYLYPGSYFLPYIEPEESTARIKRYLLSRSASPLSAITAETVTLGIYKISAQREKFAQLQYLYQTTEQDLEDYVFGFTTPCCLIFAAQLVQLAGVETVIQKLAPPIVTPRDEEFTSYMKKHIYSAQSFFVQSSKNKPVEAAQPIYSICTEDLFINSLYYRIGHAASEAVFADLCNLIQF